VIASEIQLLSLRETNHSAIQKMIKTIILPPGLKTVTSEYVAVNPLQVRASD
jgi:hypothetical protein